MGPLIAFGIGISVYSLIDRRDKWFVLSQCIASGVLIGGGVLILTICQEDTRGPLIGSLFIIAGLLPRLLIPQHPIEADGGSNSTRQHLVSIGIIDFVWICVMGVTLAIIEIASGASPFVVTIEKGMHTEYYDKLFEITVFLLRITIDGVFLLGGILAGCMAILWAGEIWRKTQDKDKMQYKHTTISAIKMVVAYFIVTLNVLVWVGVPLYQKMIKIADILKEWELTKG